MSDLDDLERYETQPAPLNESGTAKSHEARRKNRRMAREMSRRGTQANLKRLMLEADGRRPAPTLAPVNWLKRPDPFDDA